MKILNYEASNYAAFFLPAATLSLLGSNILLSTLLLNTLAQSHTKTDKILVYDVLAFRF
jgi:hypothetical protein